MQDHFTCRSVELQNKLLAHVRTETPTGFRDFLDFLHSRPVLPAGESLGEFEYDLVDWGSLYGVAYGIARGEDPWESNADVAERAFDAAWAVWDSWAGGEFHERHLDPIVRDVIAAFDAVQDRLYHGGFAELGEALARLSNQRGVRHDAAPDDDGNVGGDR
jgi:hypothetical protein